MRINMMLRTVLLAALSCLPWVAGGAQANRSAAAWRDLTLSDVEAAHGIIARNHPGAAPSALDTAFRGMLANATAAARSRAAAVTSYEGWLATIRAFAAAFDDPHISLQARLTLTTVRWPGFMVGRRGDAIVVTSSDTTTTGTPAIGATLVSCDGTPAEQFARLRLGVFRGTWEVASQRVRNTRFLLVDDGNPFLPPPRQCVVREGGTDRAVTLAWRAITNTALQPMLRDAAPVGSAGFGLRRVGNGWWIGIESLNSSAAAVLDSVSAHAARIRAAPWVVVDVRGNGGGSSEWARRLAVLLVGEDRTAAAMRNAESAQASTAICGASWRASSDVAQTIEGYIRDLGPRLGERTTQQWRQELDSVRAALGESRDLAPAPVPCAARNQSRAPALPPANMTGRLVLLTDHACFSSCLLLAALFREIGALHVGEGTDFSTRYMEVRGFPLPSGLGNFATLQRAAFAMPMRLGPFEPEIPWQGRMDDTPGLEAWIPQIIR